MGHSGRETIINAKTTSNVYSSFLPMSQQYRTLIEEHPQESIIISQLQSLHILFGCKLNSDADAVNLSIDNKIPTIPTIPTIIPSHGTS